MISSREELLSPNTRICFGIFWFVIAMICIADKIMNNLDLRLFDWIGWLGMFTAGTASIIEGIKLKKNNAEHPSSK